MDAKRVKVWSFLVALTVCLLLLFLYSRNTSPQTGMSGNAAPASAGQVSPGASAGYIVPGNKLEPTPASSTELFLNVPAAISCSSESASRIRTAQMNREALVGLSPGDELRLNLFDDASYDVRVRDRYDDVNGASVLTGTIGGDSQDGVLYMSTFNGRTVAFADVPSEDRLFSSGTGNGTDYSIFEQDRKRMDILKMENDVLLAVNRVLPVPAQPGAGLLLASDIPSARADSSETVIDVMFVYTRLAKTWAENSYQGPMENIMAIAVARANMALANSGVHAKFRLVHSQEIAYSAEGENKGSSSNDLLNMTSSVSIAEMRSRYGADIVTLATACEDIGGIGWIFNGNQQFAFNVCRVKQLANSYTYAHECGHNLGCGHSKGRTVHAAGFFPYSYGWQWTARDGKGYHTVMAYDSDSYPTAVPYYSNPSLLFKGVRMGVLKEADNALTIERLKGIASSFRDPAANQ